MPGIDDWREKDRKRRAKAERDGAIVACLLGVLALLVIAGYGHWAYGDWTCGFKECRIIKEQP
jgi:hypothetical protein